jgi:flagellar hook-basal body complex protein FliE
MIDLKTLDALSAYNKVGGLTGSYPTDNVAETGGPNFTQLVEEALGKTVDKFKTAEAKATQSITGEVSMEDLAVAVANAEMSLKTVIAIRDKLVTAFQDIIRMPI